MSLINFGRRLATYILNVALFVAAGLAIARFAAAAESVDGESTAINTVRVGIADHIKAGHWSQVQVSVKFLMAPKDARISVTAPDNDGVPTIATTPLPEQTIPDADRVGTLYTNIGRLGTPIDVALAEEATTVETQSLRASATAVKSDFVELPSTAELLLYFGPISPQMLDAHTTRAESNGQLMRKAVRMEVVDHLPDQWFGYDAVDVAVLSVGDGGPFDKFGKLLADDEQRFNAFVRWIELGGRLVLFCGGENAKELLGEGRPLATLLPGKLAEVVRLPETGRLEHFSGSEVPIGGQGSREAILVPRLVDVAGKVEVYEGRRASDLPLVVRAPRGLGEITFVAIDPNKSPFADWPGHKLLVEAVMRPYLDGDNSAHTKQTLVTRGYNDLSGALRQKLGRTFTGVRPFAFSLVTLFAVAYLLVLGPLDYFVVRRWFKTSWAAWLTFPAIVLLFGGLALALAERRQGGGERRINQLELVDVDAASGQARGTVWSTVYSPAADRLDLRLDVELLSDNTGRAETLLHSWALPGAGIGGTQSGGMNLVSTEGYRYSDNFDALLGVPILTSGTKSLLARWTAPAEPLVLAELTNKDGLATGSIENRTGRKLRNVRLYYGEWGYKLGTITDGTRKVVEEPRMLKTIVTQDSLAVGAQYQLEEHVFVAEQASLKEIANVMMFYEAVGGFSFAQLLNRFQAYCDLSRFPMLGRAVLVADVETKGSRLVDAESGKALGDQDSATVIYRFVLPVRNE